MCIPVRWHNESRGGDNTVECWAAEGAQRWGTPEKINESDDAGQSGGYSEAPKRTGEPGHPGAPTLRSNITRKDYVIMHVETHITIGVEWVTH